MENNIIKKYKSSSSVEEFTQAVFNDKDPKNPCKKLDGSCTISDNPKCTKSCVHCSVMFKHMDSTLKDFENK